MEKLEQALHDLGMILDQVRAREDTRQGDLFLMGRIEGLKEAMEVLDTIRKE